ncbi:SUPPRESSOR OF GAMMA RESPONSE 1 [Argentina anserina]|uniref:SUPPRESSOR OF GAMMA RESPONSE 1 n=1 Tax=Argentina anserina TaxID=57926 RepID=UPI0021768ABA|nr:SUPPRESSOR OF GAMMA RESPONSE 1 [Potentilla anserina]
MAGTSWLVDKKRIATKIRNPSTDPGKIKWQTNPTKACPNCQYVIDNSDVSPEWPGLPKGVKFDPTDQEIIWHLLAKSGAGDMRPHPFIDAFITDFEVEDGVLCSHPKKLPGIKQDGSVSHFFHVAIKAYNTGTRKRRKIHDDDYGDIRWHKTGRTKPVILDGVQRGCKKIMVLYTSTAKGGKAEKTNWVMHQYHLGTDEDEKDGEYVVSKIYYQQQQVKQADKTDQNSPESSDPVIQSDPFTPKSVIPEPVSPAFNLVVDIPAACTEPKSVTPEPPRPERRHSNVGLGEDTHVSFTDPFLQMQLNHHDMDYFEDEVPHQYEMHACHDQHIIEILNDQAMNNDVNHTQEDPKWWDSESQNLLDSQQLVEGLSLCDDLLQSQSPTGGVHANGEPAQTKPCLADYAKLGPEDLKKDLEECQNIIIDPPNMELGTPPDFRLSQIEFESQDSILAWGGKLPE